MATHGTDWRDRRARIFRLGRWVVLLVVLAFSTVIGILHQRVPSLRTVGVDALCPFGGIESFWKVATGGPMIQKIEVGSFVLLVGSLALAFVFGRAFCGHFCPLGTLQEIVEAVRGRLRIRRVVVPHWLDRPLRLVKYVVLVVLTALTWQLGTLVVRPFDPWAAYHHIFSAELLTGFGVGLAILVVSLAASFFVDRAFCKYACPMGAFLGIASKVQWFRIARNADACVDCGVCDKVCSMNCAVSTAEVVQDGECIACGLCVAACPKPGALEVKGRATGSRAVQPVAILVGTLAILGGLVGVTTATGDMQFTKPPLAQQVLETQAAGAAPVPGATSSQAFDTSLIRGYMSMAEVAQATGIPADELRHEFGISEEQMARPLKELKDDAGFDTDAVRQFVAERSGGGYVPKDDVQGGEDACSGD